LTLPDANAHNPPQPPDSRAGRVTDTGDATPARRSAYREAAGQLLVCLGFVGLTVLMTWPWVLNLRDAAADPGDSYLNAWIMWWDYHATFSDPLDLFHANIFYPYRYSLAFSENNYGLALPFFPLYALGLRPLTVHGVATLAGFALCGYGMFRLARTLTGSDGTAWVAGVAFAFVPYRFHHLPHVNYLFAGWIPLLLEALVLFARERSWKRAAWLGVAFLMNGLTCIHWFVLTIIPLALTALFLVLRRGSWRDFVIRGGVALGVASAALLPFLVPYLRVTNLYGLVRKPAEVAVFSARLSHWLTADWQHKLWEGLGGALTPYQTELALFPGLLPVLFALAAVFPLLRRGDGRRFTARRLSVALLDAVAVGAAAVLMLAAVYGSVRFRPFGYFVFSASSPERPFALAAAALLLRCLLARPGALRPAAWRRLFAHGDDGGRAEAVGIGLLWAVVGFAGSFGMNFVFHRALYDYVPLFRSTRVPARWAMICFVGLSLLAALGVRRVAQAVGRGRGRRAAVVYACAVVLLLFEQREAPLKLIRGAADPDALTLRMRRTPMKGGVVELPTGTGYQNYLYVLRAADHERPLVNGVSGFMPPIVAGVERMTKSDPVPDRFLDLLEAIPASYLVVHHGALPVENRGPVGDFLRRGLGAGRLRLVGVYGEGATRDELYAVTRTEPEASPEAPPPPSAAGD
jgi:hypothetical protein